MDDIYPVPVETLLQTLDELFSHLGQDRIAALLREADGSIDWEGHDNWNGGIESYALNLKVPVAAFATVDAKRDAVEKLLLQKVGAVTRQFDRDVITSVRIIPESRTAARSPNAQDLSPDVLRRIWERDGFRLFITHRAQDKSGAAEVKAKLSPYGVCGFVAHQDIAPNQIWQSEIERALVSMHALAALITPGFDTSVWSQQEIGFALGRGVPVIPVRVGSDPHGFIARIQALSADLSNPTTMGSALVDTLLKDSRTAAMMRERLVREFESAKTWETARLLRPKIVLITEFSDAQLSRIEKALTENEKVATAYGVPEAIKQLLTRHGR